MNLLIDAHCFDYDTSEGVNTYLQGLYGALINETNKINFYFIANDIDKIKNIFKENKKTHYIPLVSKNKLYRLIFEIPKIIKKHKIDIAHFQYISPLIKNCKTIITLHDILFIDYPQYFPTKYKITKGILFKLSAKRADLLLTVSEYSQKQISKHYKIPEHSIFVTPNAVSNEYFHIDKNEADNFIKNKGIKKHILYISRIEPRKNQLALLKAYCELKLWEKQYDLVFIGRKTLPTPEYDTYYNSLPKEIKNKIHFINQVSYDDLLLWYKSASLFVYPTLAEGFGIPPIEAGAAGIPCICSKKTAMNDFTFFGKNLIDINDNDLLKNTIIDNLINQNTEDAVQISKIIKEKYNWKNTARKYYDILLKL